MLWGGLRIVLAAWLLAFAGSAAMAAKRVALVIGNGAYTNAPALTNPKNDAEDMAAALKALGFTVILGTDLDKRAMDRKILEFEAALSGADAGVFHYSGHGLQVAGVNYLVPVDAELSSPAALRIEAVRLDFVQETMEREAKTNILFLDACRNNPLARNLARSLGTRSADIGHGLAAAESGVGTLVSFSTQPGNVALDGQGRNSPYSGPLAKAIGTPGEDILSILTAVRNEVLTATGQKQVPWENHALTAKFYFNPSAATQAPAQAGEAAQAWIAVQGTTSEAVLEEYIRRFPNSVYAGFAKARLGELKSKSEASWWPWSEGKPAEAGKPQDTQANAGQTKPALAPKETQVAVVAPPAPAIPAEPACDGLLVAVAQPGARPCIKPGSGESFKDCPECPEMVVVPAGSFTMGSPDSEPKRLSSEGPQHKVTIGEPFAAGRFAVTRDQFDAFVKDSGHSLDGGCFVYTGAESNWKQDNAASFRSPGFIQTGLHPAVCVNWNDAKAYVAWLSRMTGKAYRLLSEAEREYAARAGTATPFWWGSSITPEQANFHASNVYGAEGRGTLRNTLPVKSFQPNPWGLYQVHGNVWEWVEDCWNGNYDGAPGDGSAKTTGECGSRVLRGSSWYNDPQYPRAAYRSSNGLSIRSDCVGFRVARTLE